MKENWVILVSAAGSLADNGDGFCRISSIRALRVRFPASNSCFVHPLERYLVVVADFSEILSLYNDLTVQMCRCTGNFRGLSQLCLNMPRDAKLSVAAEIIVLK